MQECDSSIIGFSVEGALLILIILRLESTEHKSTWGNGKTGHHAALLLFRINFLSIVGTE